MKIDPPCANKKPPNKRWRGKVISMEDWVTIRNLKKHNPNLGTRKIAEVLNISRNTVKRALRSESYPGYKRKKKVNEELLKFSEFIKESYLLKKQKVSVIISNLRSKGFQGSDTSVYRYVNENLKESRKDQNNQSYEPYSTSPGEQFQYDWSEYKVRLGEEVRKIYVHCLICGFSRYRVYDISLDKKQSTILSVLEEGFESIGGLCKRIQVDNAPQFVSDARVRSLKWNKSFLDFCGYYGIEPSRSLPYHPWSKGKVENPFKYLEDHFITNNKFESIEDFILKLKEFEKRVNNKMHLTTRKSPFELFAKEKEYLMKLPEEKYVGIYDEYRKVTTDCLISYMGNKYSVPHYFVGKEVWIKSKKGLELEIYSQSRRLIAKHKLSLKKGEIIIDKSHYKSKSYNESSNYEKLSLLFMERFYNYEKSEEFLLKLKNEKRLNERYHLSKILDVLSYYDDAQCISVLNECLRYNNYSYRFIMSLLSLSEFRSDNIEHSRDNSVIMIDKSKNIKRNLEEYKICQN